MRSLAAQNGRLRPSLGLLGDVVIGPLKRAAVQLALGLMRGTVLAAENDVVASIRWTTAKTKGLDPKSEEAKELHVDVVARPTTFISKLAERLNRAVLDLKVGGGGLRVRMPGSR